MSSVAASALLALGAALIVHASFAAAQYAALLEGRGEARDRLPLDVYAELALAFAAVLVGALASAPAFASIYTAGGSPMDAFHKLFAVRRDFEVIAPPKVAESTGAR